MDELKVGDKIMSVVGRVVVRGFVTGIGSSGGFAAVEWQDADDTKHRNCDILVSEGTEWCRTWTDDARMALLVANRFKREW